MVREFRSNRTEWKFQREEEHTDEVADVEGMVVGPESIVDSGVPPPVGAHNVVGGGDDAGRGDEDEEKDAELDRAGHLHSILPSTLCSLRHKDTRSLSLSPPLFTLDST